MNNLDKKVLFIAQDAGGANYIMPVLEKWGENNSYKVFTAEPASTILSAFSPIYCDAPVLWEDLLQIGTKILDAEMPDLVITGTSWGPSLDKAFLLAAKHLAIPTISVVDHWEFYAERFSKINSGNIVEEFIYLPDKIILNDNFAFGEAIISGLPADRLIVGGQPHLERVYNSYRNRSYEQKSSSVLFVSERIRKYISKSSREYPGWDEFKVLKDLLQIIDFTRDKLIVKLHPLEDFSKFSQLLKGYPEVKIIGGLDDNFEEILGSRKIVGISSMLLLESGMFHSEVISYMPSEKHRDFIGNRLGITKPATDVKTLKQILKTENFPGNNSFGEKYVGSLDRVIDIIKEEIVS